LRINLDDTDLRILGILQKEGRITNAELAKRVGLSPPSALQRVRGLERSGVIKNYVALLDSDKLGMKVMVFAMVRLSLHQEQPIERFRRGIAEIPEVVESYHLSGDFDYLLKILVPDIRSYETLIREKVSRIRGIRQIVSSFVLGVPKYTTNVPFDQP
jgi:Lrp/AsnC family leucine-responsive transcriptional regulator